ncbi:MAG TPA: SRPBCC family protein [Dehalococcoidia bacterium]|nr:SRPBCC family protein [Dehalococcoidia bacterium]
MAINIEERFQVQTPIAEVWRFLVDPRQVVTCMPGAELVEVVDERTSLGNIKIQVGPITATYKGRVQFTEMEEGEHRVEMVAEGREAGGGGARSTIRSQLATLPSGDTEVMVQAQVELTGRIVQYGRGMIEDVSRQVFRRFAACVKERLEAPVAAGAAQGRAIPLRGSPGPGGLSREGKAEGPSTSLRAGPGGSGSKGAAAPTQTEPLRILPLTLGAMRRALGRLLRRGAGRRAA